MGRNSKSGRPPLSSDEISLLRTLQDECTQIRTELKNKTAKSAYLNLKHWVKSKAIPLYNGAFHFVDSEEADVSTIFLCIFFVLY